MFSRLGEDFANCSESNLRPYIHSILERWLLDILPSDCADIATAVGELSMVQIGASLILSSRLGLLLRISPDLQVLRHYVVDRDLVRLIDELSPQLINEVVIPKLETASIY